MIALTPQFASLLVALTATAVQGAPHGGHHYHGRRFVVGAEVSGIDIHAHLAKRLAARHSAAREEVSNQGTKSVYVMHSRARGSASGEGQSHAIRLASHSDSTRMTRRGLDDPIDEPDSEDSKQNDVQAQQTDDPEDESTEESEDEGDRNEDSQLQKRGYYVDDVYGTGLIIAHAQPHAHRSHAVAIYDIQRRGLLDPVVPILGSLPGIGGIISIIADTLGNVINGLPILGPILGGLILSPHKSPTAQGLNDTVAPPEYYLDASSTRNASAIYLVESGQPSPFAIASQNAGNNNTMNERLVSLQMAFVNSETGKVEAYCATFKGSDGNQDGPAALAALPCITDGVTEAPHPSQLWGYNPANNAVRPMWNHGHNSDKHKTKRAYLIQTAGGDNATLSEGAGDDMDSVVLVFKPWESDSKANATQAGAMYDSKEADNWQVAEGNGTTEEKEDPTEGQTEDKGASEEAYDEGVPVFVAGAGRHA